MRASKLGPLAVDTAMVASLPPRKTDPWSHDG